MDLFHSPQGTAHVLIGTSDEPCLVLSVGSRLGYPGLMYPRDETAVRHGRGTWSEQNGVVARPRPASADDLAITRADD